MGNERKMKCNQCGFVSSNEELLCPHCKVPMETGSLMCRD